MNKLKSTINSIVNYAVEKNFIENEDICYSYNRIFSLLKIDGFQISVEEVLSSDTSKKTIYQMIDELVAYADENKLLDKTMSYQVDNFYSELINVFAYKPSELNKKFKELYKESPEKATKFFYDYSIDSTYIRMDRIAKNIKWETPTGYGNLEITINLSKPEKDPKEIAAAKANKSNGEKYPSCLLCKENVGYTGKIDHPARQNHRIVKMELGREDWYLQYSPYVYFNEHAIILCNEHRDMKITEGTFERVFDFVDILPHYCIGSNADLPIVGGSILTHDHYQGGNYEFPMMNAKSVYEKTIEESNIKLEILKWPLSVVKLSGKDREVLIKQCVKMLENWKKYSDMSNEILCESIKLDGKIEEHNTFTPVLRKKNGVYECFLALRNNRTDDIYPDGIFHPHKEYHNIKKENIGLIEVMGVAILPGRLKSEIDDMVSVILETKGLLKDVKLPESLVKHREWLEKIMSELEGSENEKMLLTDSIKMEEYIKDKIGETFSYVLENAGVFKQDKKGIAAFIKYVESIV